MSREHRPARASSRGARAAASAWLWRASPLLCVLGALLLWELLVRLDVLDSRYMPSMIDTLTAFVDQLGQPGFWSAVGSTLRATLVGVGIAAAAAVPAGMLIGSSQLTFRATRVVVEFLRPIPSVALIPLAVLTYGTGLASAVFLAAFASFWPLLIQTYYGVQDVDPIARDTARAFGLRRWTRLRWIELPSALPFLATGMRIALTISLILVVTAQLVIGVPGLGKEIIVAQSSGALPETYALVVATGLLGWLLNAATQAGERRALRWHPSHRKAAV